MKELPSDPSQAPEAAQASTPRIPGTPLSRRELFRLGGVVVAAITAPPALYLPFLQDGPDAGHLPPTAAPPEPTRPNPTEVDPTAVPSPEATEITIQKELLLAAGSAVVENPFDTNTMWELAERFATGLPVTILGTETDKNGNQYHKVTIKDGIVEKTGWVLQAENNVPVDTQKPIEEVVAGRSSTLVDAANPLILQAGSKESELRLIANNIIVEGNQDFTYYLRAIGTAQVVINDHAESNKIIISPNSNKTVTVSIEGPSQQSTDKPITLATEEVDKYGLVLQVSRGVNDDNLTVEPWLIDANAQKDTTDKPEVVIRKGFTGTHIIRAGGTNTDLTLQEMIIERGLMNGISRQDLKAEYQKGGGIYARTGQKIGIGEWRADFDEQFVAADKHGVVQYIHVGNNRPGDRFFPGTNTYRGLSEADFQFNRFKKLGVSANFPVYLNFGLTTDQRAPTELLMDRDQVVQFLKRHPTAGVSLNIFDNTGAITAGVSPLSWPLYPDKRGQPAGGAVQATVNAIRFYNNLNQDPSYMDPITHEYAPRPVDIPLSNGTTGAAIDPILSGFDQIKAAGNTYVRAISISPANLTEREVEKLVTGIHQRKFLVRFEEVGRVKADGSPSPHSEVSLQRLCDRIGVPIDVMGTYAYGPTILDYRNGRNKYNDTIPGGSPLKGSPYTEYLSVLQEH